MEKPLVPPKSLLELGLEYAQDCLLCQTMGVNPPLISVATSWEAGTPTRTIRRWADRIRRAVGQMEATAQEVMDTRISVWHKNPWRDFQSAVWTPTLKQAILFMRAVHYRPKRSLRSLKTTGKGG